MDILFACDTNISRPWHRDRLPSIEAAVLDLDLTIEIVDIYSLLGNFDESPTNVSSRKHFFRNCNLVEINQTFLYNILELKPGVLILGTADNYRDFLLPKTIRHLRGCGVVVSGILGDDEFNYHQYKFFLGWFDSFVGYVKPCIDFYEQFGLAKGFYLPNSCYLPSKDLPIHLDDAVYDVILIGSPIANRPEIVEALVGARVNLAIYGSKEWNKYDYARSSYHGYIETEKFDETLAKSNIVLALLEDHATGQLHMNTKIWEAVRVGRLPIVTFYQPLIDDYNFVEGAELVMYRDIPDLVSKVIGYTDKITDRLEVTKNLYNRVFEDFNYINLYKSLFKALVSDNQDEPARQYYDTYIEVPGLLLARHNAVLFSPNNNQIDPSVLDVIEIIKKDKKEIDVVYFNRTEKGSQVLQYRPFISLDSVIFLVPVKNKYHMVFILIKTLFSKRIVHVKQFCIESSERSLVGLINNIIDGLIYSSVGYKLRGFMYRFYPVKKMIQQILKF